MVGLPSIDHSRWTISCLEFVVSPRQEELSDLRSPILQAAAAGCKAEVLSHLNRHSHNSSRSWALCFACRNGHADCVKALLDHGADPSERGVRSQSPLYHAADNGQVEAARLLVDAGCDINDNHVQTAGGTALGQAASAGHHEFVKFMISIGARVSRCGKNQYTPLQLAVRYGRYETARVLLESGMDPDQVDVQVGDQPYQSLESQDIPLQMASFGGNAALVQLLAAYGADVNHSSPQGRLPLRAAASMGHVATTYALLQAGASVDQKGSSQSQPYGTPLMAAVRAWCYPSRAKLQNTRNSNNHYLSKRFENTIRVLLAFGADPSALTWPPFEKGDLMAGKFLQQRGYDRLELAEQGERYSNCHPNTRSKLLDIQASAQQGVLYTGLHVSGHVGWACTWQTWASA